MDFINFIIFGWGSIWNSVPWCWISKKKKIHTFHQILYSLLFGCLFFLLDFRWPSHISKTPFLGTRILKPNLWIPRHGVPTYPWFGQRWQSSEGWGWRVTHWNFQCHNLLVVESTNPSEKKWRKSLLDFISPGGKIIISWKRTTQIRVWHLKLVTSIKWWKAARRKIKKNSTLTQ